jgi:hypothetical protein
MSEYSGFILVDRNTLGLSIFVGCHRMSENSGVGLHKFHCLGSENTEQTSSDCVNKGNNKITKGKSKLISI